MCPSQAGLAAGQAVPRHLGDLGTPGRKRHLSKTMASFDSDPSMHPGRDRICSSFLLSLLPAPCCSPCCPKFSRSVFYSKVTPALWHCARPCPAGGRAGRLTRRDSSTGTSRGAATSPPVSSGMGRRACHPLPGTGDLGGGRARGWAAP